jgi:maltose/maltodextrin transport system substrate-binding protein
VNRSSSPFHVTTLLALLLGLALSPLTPAQSPDDTSLPVRPGQPGVRPFWNTHALRFIYAPAFDLPKTDGATTYRFTVTAHDGRTHTFTAPQPSAPLTPVWNQVAEGYTTLTVQPLDPAGKELGKPSQRIFYRSPGFPGTAAAPLKPYDQAGREGLQALFDAPHVRRWLTDPKPDRTYARYCYPNKVIGGLLRGMTAYSKIAQKDEDRAAALKIARATADYLLSLRYPADAAYANVAPTYALNVDKPAGATGLTRERVQKRWLLITSIVDAAFGYLDLYDVTKEQKYLEAAVATADTLARRQEPDGTWPLMADWQTGQAVAPNRLIPTWVIFLFDRLDRQYALPQYRDARRRAWDWIVANPLKTYQWDAQFEDIQLRGPYENLAREQACDVAVLLLGDPHRTPKQINQAQDLIRFAEDQFVCWAPVADVPGWRKAMPRRYQNADIWILPGVFEQYVCYGPVARSSAILINTYLKAHAVTGNATYLEKARALANGMLEGQNHAAENYGTHGEIPTWNMRRPPINWLNNSYYAAEAVLNLAHYLAQDGKVQKAE